MAEEQKRGRIETAWLSYRHMVMPAEVSETQMVETKRAFYAGAKAFQTSVLAMLEGGSEATDSEVASMEEMHQELLQFAKDVKDGRA